jgi:hypothetical protein
MGKKKQMKAAGKLPQAKGEVWEVGRRDIPVPVAELEQAGEQPEILLVVQAGEQPGVVLGEVIGSNAPPHVLSDFVGQAMKKPLFGKPRRPGVIRVGAEADAAVLGPVLAEAGVRLEVAPRLGALDTVGTQLGQMSAALLGDYRTHAAQAGQPLSEVGLREFFQAAAEFYEWEPWLDFGEEELFEIELEPGVGPSKTLYGVIMGSSEQTLGLALYPSMDDLRKLYDLGEQHGEALLKLPEDLEEEPLDSEQWQVQYHMLSDVMSIPSLSLNYSSTEEIPPPLLQEALDLRLPVADEDGFPSVMKTGGGHLQPPTADDFRYLLWALRALLDWDEQLTEIEPEDDLDVTITATLPAVADFSPAVTTHTTLRQNPFVPELDEDMLAEDMDELMDLFGAFLESQALRKPPAQAKKGKKPSKKKAATKKPAAQPSSASPQLYTLNVFLTGGPMDESFEGEVISRKVQLLGGQTLHDLHQIIFDAFEREEEHLYEFNLGAGPRDRSQAYLYKGEWSEDDEEEGDPESATLDALDLTVGRRFGYVFDMGDYWEHIIEVVAVEEHPPSSIYPRIVETVGEAPPQYPDFDEEE